jgi:phytoene dehydrogenase-like protein
MTDPGRVLIVGAGIAGLSCARYLVRAGVPVRLFESSDAVGGRVRTDEVQGFRLDRGFQTFLTAYPEARALLDYDALELRHFEPGALVRASGRFHRISDPFRDPLATPRTLLAPVGSFLDKLRILRLRQQVTAGDVERLFARPEISTSEALSHRYHFSAKMRRRFFDPFLRGVLLDPNLGTSSRAFEFYFRMFSIGSAAVPAEGMQRIPEQLASGLGSRAVMLNTRVQSVASRGVTIEGGDEVEGRAVVLAVEGPELAYLVEGFEPPASRSTFCLYFATPTPPHDDAVLVLNGEPSGIVNHLAVMTSVSDRLAPPGQSLVSVSVVGNPVKTDGEVEMLVREQIRSWYGDAVDSWQLLKTYRILHALPAQDPPALSPPRRPARLAGGLYVAGDHRTNASINGAMESGRLAAEAVLRDLAAEA